MKKAINISQKWRKLTAVLLLLNFVFAPFLNAFSQEECNGVCETESAIHECSCDSIEQAEMNCCDMIEMNSKNKTATTSQCEMELSDISCALVFNEQANHSYVIPKTIDYKVEFVQLSTIDMQEDNSSIELYELVHEFSFENKPPIYLTISSFLN